MLQALSPKEDWYDLEGVTYLYTGAHAPALRATHEALSSAFRQQSQGSAGRDFLYTLERAARVTLAALSNLTPEEVAFVGDASTAWNLVANGMDWTPGDNVVLNELEHPSVTFPFLRLKRYGLEVRVVPKDSDWMVSPQAIERACDAQTKAIALSHTAYLNGYRHDIQELGDLADRRGIPLFVDWSHSLGVLPIDMQRCAVGISASYKWTLGPYGVGIIMWNRDRFPDFRPGGSGWRSVEDIFTDDRFETFRLSPDAGRFQLGASSFSGIAGLGASAEYLRDFGVDRLSGHALALSRLCRDGLVELGLHVITPDKDDHRGGSVAFLHPKSDLIAAALERRGVLVWGGDGRVRASFHLMNGESDVRRYVSELAAVLPNLAT